MTPQELTQLSDAIQTAITNGFNSLQPSQGGQSTGNNGGAQPPSNQNNTQSSGDTGGQVVGVQQSIADYVAQGIYSFGSISATAVDEITLMQEESGVSLYRNLIKNFGEEIRKIDSQDLLARDFSEISNAAVKVAASSYMDLRDSIVELGYYEGLDADNQIRMRRDLIENLGDANINLLHAYNDEIQDSSMVFSNALNLQIDDVSRLISIRFAETGEASANILDEVTNQAKVVGDAVGVPLLNMAHGITEIKLDMETFTDVTISGAARMTASLNQLGLSLGSFKQLLGGFRDFDSAATRIGDLSSVFGVHMEMMYLANEDQEEFLHRFRDQLVSQGVDVENMSQTRQRYLASELNMNMEEVKNFLRGDITDLETLRSETQDASLMSQSDAFETLESSMVTSSKSASRYLANMQDIQGFLTAPAWNTAIEGLARFQQVTTDALTNSTGLSNVVNQAQIAAANISAASIVELEEAVSSIIPEIEEFADPLSQTIGNSLASMSSSVVGSIQSISTLFQEAAQQYLGANSWPLWLQPFAGALGDPSHGGGEMLEFYQDNISRWGNKIREMIGAEISEISNLFQINPGTNEIVIRAEDIANDVSGAIYEATESIVENFNAQETQVNVNVDINKIKADIVSAIREGLTEGFNQADYGFNLFIDRQQIATVMSESETIEGNRFSMIAGAVQ